MTTPDARRRLTDWFRQWRSPLRKFLIGKSALPLSELEDVSQEVFLRLLRYDQAELVEHPQAYLFKMASNVAAEWSVRANVRHPHDSHWLTDLLSDDQPEDNAEREASRTEVRRALETLSPRYREILKLQFTEGLGYAEIAERVGATPRTVKRCIQRSYEKLRLELKTEPSGVMSHGRE